mgnify:CR=1 FL=1
MTSASVQATASHAMTTQPPVLTDLRMPVGVFDAGIGG